MPVFVRLACMRHVNTNAVAPPLTPRRVTLTAKEIAERKKARQALADRAYDGAKISAHFHVHNPLGDAIRPTGQKPNLTARNLTHNSGES
jgi:hypothetical protein